MKNFIFLLLILPLFTVAQAKPATENGVNAVTTEIEESNDILANIEANTSNSGLNAAYLGSTVGLGSDCTTIVTTTSGGLIFVKQSMGTGPRTFWIAVTPASSTAAFQILPVRETLLEAKIDLLFLFNKINGVNFALPTDCTTLNAAVIGL